MSEGGWTKRGMRSPSAPGLGQESCPSAVPTPSRTSEHLTPRLNCPRTSRREQPRKPSSRYFTRARGRGDREPVAAVRVEAPAVTTSIPPLLGAGSRGSARPHVAPPQPLLAPSVTAAGPGEAGRVRQYTWAEAWLCPRGGESLTWAGLRSGRLSPGCPLFLDLSHSFPEARMSTPRWPFDGLGKGRIRSVLLFEGKKWHVPMAKVLVQNLSLFGVRT